MCADKARTHLLRVETPERKEESMKHVKRLLAVVIAMTMVMAMGLTAFANSTITITSPTGHKYEVFQVFKGTVDANNPSQLNSLKYGKNAATGDEDDAVSQKDMTDLKAIADGTYADDQAKIAVLKKYVDFESTPIVASVNSEAATAELEPGYYVIRDIAAEAPAGDGLTLYMFKVLNDNLSISAKSDKPSSEKKVQDINDTEDDNIDDNDWQDSADHEIGDTIPYKLTFTLPSDYANYKKYYVQFKDHISAGLTYNNDAKIYYGSDTTGEAIDFAKSGMDFSYTIDDLKTGTDKQKALKAGDVITIKYTCYLNKDAVIGNPGNPNTYKVEFSRDPNQEGQGKPDTSETPEDSNVVFTYESIFNKVDEDNNPLEGADFTLFKIMKDGSEVDVTTLGTSAHPKKTGSSAEKSKTFSFKGLDDGKYKLVETFTPSGYNKIDDITFTISANHVVEGDLSQLVLTSLNATGGLKISGNVAEGTLTTSIENKSGAVLPTTGGVGTTIFYIVGAVLALGAGVLLVTKRRMAG